MCSWLFDAKLPLEVVVPLLEVLEDVAQDLAMRSLVQVFRAMVLNPLADSKVYCKCFGWGARHLKSGGCTVSDLCEWKLIEAFVTGTDPRILAEILADGERRSIIQRVYAVFDCKFRAFRAILNTAGFIRDAEFTRTATQFFLPSGDLVKELLAWFQETKNSTAFELLMHAFREVPAMCRCFLGVDGLQWLEDTLDETVLSSVIYADLLASLVFSSRFDEVDDYIGSLPASHPIFSLSQEVLDKIVYGMNASQSRPKL
jgi:hypothetical protein